MNCVFHYSSPTSTAGQENREIYFDVSVDVDAKAEITVPLSLHEVSVEQ